MASKKSLYTDVDIVGVEVEAKKRWEKEYRRRQSLERIIVNLLPVGLLILNLIFFMFSAPHTQRLMEMITSIPAGFASPLAFELGILILSALREAGLKNKLTWVILYTLLIMSIVINISGSLISVIEISGSQLSQLTFNQIISGFGKLPIIYQIVLLIAIPVSALIPPMGKLSGEIIIKLALGRIKISISDLDVSWAREVAQVMHKALFKAAIDCGAGADLAGKFATEICTNMYGVSSFQNSSSAISQLRLEPAAPTADTSMQLTPMQEVFAPKVRVSRDELKQWMNQNSARVSAMSNREVARAYSLESLGSDSDGAYKTVERIRNGG